MGREASGREAVPQPLGEQVDGVARRGGGGAGPYRTAGQVQLGLRHNGTIVPVSRTQANRTGSGASRRTAAMLSWA
jgi:hypothetical protein